MRKFSEIYESAWDEMQDRGTGDVEKKEDILVGAVKNLVPVDLGGKCLWADRDLEIDGQTAFTYDDASQFIDGVNGWRLPTFTDIMNLDTRIMYNDYSFQDDELHITYKKTNGELVFSNQGPYPRLKGFYYFWHVDGGIRYGKASCFIKDKNNKCTLGSFGSSYSGYTFCIRLVKDKEVSESVWSDMEDRGTGDVDKKEDAVINSFNCEELAKYLGQEYYDLRYNFTITYVKENDEILTNAIIDHNDRGNQAYYYGVDYKHPNSDDAVVLISAKFVVYDPKFRANDCLRDVLMKRYDIEITSTNPELVESAYFRIYPKGNGKVTNRFYIEVIDCIIDNADKRLDIQLRRK